jgi:hypothetical protein
VLNAEDIDLPEGETEGTRLVKIWLPREGDWLDLLEAEGCCGVTVGRDSREGLTDNAFYAASYDDGTFEDYGERRGPDRLTALCRLYMAVKGILDDPIS